ncbi:alpha/beta fold hydrolase [Aridibaculum aurantiacum]|uniref:alpha/beta fold hydrolase n=1 Tax=Aridibaculum aurantiacum TaxID=2810307 RepID=UPI001A96C696|nr:alpha/beta hydrolase [Aridibaculum aurantiacum]
MKTSVLERYNVTITGEGKQPMMFAHGLGCTQIMWRYIYPAFEKDYKIILFDYLGNGGSSSQSNYESIQDHANDVLEIIEALQLQEVIYVGHSISSMIGMLASIKSRGVFSKMIMVAPSPRYINDKDYVGGFDKHEIQEVLAVMKENMNNWAKMFMPQVVSGDNAAALSEELRASFCNTDNMVAYKFAEQAFNIDLRDQLHKHTTPTLILQGTNDIVVPERVGHYLKENLQNSTLVVMKAVGHYAHLSAPGETVELIQQYLQEN